MEPTRQPNNGLGRTARSVLLGATALTAAGAVLSGPAQAEPRATAAPAGADSPAPAAGPPQLAQSGETVAFAIEAQALEDALAAFEEATGLTLAYNVETVEGLQSDGLQGRYTPRAALERLLAGTGLSYRLAGGTATIARAGGMAELEALDVEGKAPTAYGPVDGYKAERSATATRTDTPIQDVPSAVKVVSREVVADQQATDLGEVVRNVSSVAPGNGFGGSQDVFKIRGFNQEVNLRNGFRADIVSSGQRNQEMANIERVEVLKGPASVMHGRLSPGGVINVVTEKPTDEPLRRAQLRTGSFGLIEQSVDLGGPLTPGGGVSYRFNALYSQKEGFRNGYDTDHERLFLSPVVAVELGQATDLTLEFSYRDAQKPFDRGLVADEDGVIDIPVTRGLGSPTDFQESEDIFASATLDHRFTEALRTRNRIQVFRQDHFNMYNDPFPSDDINRGDTIPRFIGANDQISWNVAAQSELHVELNALGVEHNVLAAADASREIEDRKFKSTDPSFAFVSANEVDPYTGEDNFRPRTRHELDFTSSDVRNRTDQYGALLQDQMTVTDRWHVLVGGRFDYVDIDEKDNQDGSVENRHDSAFTPRAGVVYQPIEPLSLYGSYSQSFQPTSATNADGELLPPERGEQLEAGAKQEWLGGQLRTSAAAFVILKNNIPKADPNAGPGSSAKVPGGEERSRGIEADVSGQLTRTVSIIGSYSYTESKILDADNNEGNERRLVPNHSGSLWTTYERHGGALAGLSVGAGVFAMTERQGNAANDYQLPAFAQIDTSLGYSHSNWEAQLNVKNVLDTRKNYRDIDYGRVGITPGQPRSFIASLSVRF